MFPNFRNVPKLFTSEDPANLHKTLGLLTTLHFIYRAYQAAVSPTHSIQLQSRDPFTFTGLLCHTALSGTSLLFHIPTNRVRMAPMIWPEFRLHSILFAYRSLAILFVHWYNPTVTFIRPVAVLTTLFSADFVSAYYKKQGFIKNEQTTMRSMPFPPDIPQSVIASVNLFYSISQVYATLIMLYRSPDAIFATLFPIQFAAFWMTLVRKGILTAGQWHTYYALSLASVYFYIYTMPSENLLIPADYITVFAFLFTVSRFYYNVNKYYLWGTIILCGYLIG